MDWNHELLDSLHAAGFSDSLPRAILVSVGHRSSLLDFHTQQLELLGHGQWRLLDHSSRTLS